MRAEPSAADNSAQVAAALVDLAELLRSAGVASAAAALGFGAPVRLSASAFPL